MQRRWMPSEYDQIDGGTFAGRFQQLGFQDILVAAERQNRTVLKQQYFPADYCTVSLIRSGLGAGAMLPPRALQKECRLHAREQ